MNENHLLSASSLLDLKAELLRKQDSQKQAKLQRGVHEGVILSKLKRSEDDKKAKKPSVEKLAVISSSVEEEENALRKSRSMLERKVLLYEKLHKGLITPDEEQSEHLLVNFEKKKLRYPQPYNEEKSLAETSETLNPSPSFTHNIVKTPDVLSPVLDEGSVKSSDNTENGPTHYQNVLHKEVRNHGVGYFSFSMEENERKNQMDLLNTLRQQTVGQREAREKLKRKQQSKLEARLAKVRQRKNIAPLEAEGESSNDSYEASDAEDEAPVEITDEANIPDETKPVRVRPWDKGKDFADLLPERKLGYKKPGELWKDNRRAERLSDFAPPVFYNKQSQKLPSRTFAKNESQSSERTADFGPPRSYIPPKPVKTVETNSEENEASYSHNDKADNNCSPEDAIAQKLAFFRQKFD